MAAPFEPFREGYEAFLAKQKLEERERRRIDREKRQEKGRQDRAFYEEHGHWPWEPTPEEVERRRLERERREAEREQQRVDDWNVEEEKKKRSKRDVKVSKRAIQLAKRKTRKGRK